MLSNANRKSSKQTMRIMVCAIVTMLILFWTQEETCSPWISYPSCFYLSINLNQILQVLAANTILFGWHIYEKFIRGRADLSQYSIKSIFVVLKLQFRHLFWKSFCSDRVFTERPVTQSLSGCFLSFSQSVLNS
jgi:hypothetical protein